MDHEGKNTTIHAAIIMKIIHMLKIICLYSQNQLWFEDSSRLQVTLGICFWSTKVGLNLGINKKWPNNVFVEHQPILVDYLAIYSS